MDPARKRLITSFLRIVILTVGFSVPDGDLEVLGEAIAIAISLGWSWYESRQAHAA